MTEHYHITPPAIPSAGVYYFVTDHGIRYEVRFGRKQNDVLSANIVFGVLNEEYDGEEYVLTNKGDVFKVMATVSKIVTLFKEAHPNIRTYEFAGEPAGTEVMAGNIPTKRTKLYMRYAHRIFNQERWKIIPDGNKVTIKKRKGQF